MIPIDLPDWIDALLLYVSTSLWCVTALLIVVSCVTSVRKLWKDWHHWTLQPDGLEVLMYRTVAEGRLRVAMWHLVKSLILCALSIAAFLSIFLDPVPPRPDTSLDQAVLRFALLIYMVCFYMAQRANDKIDDQVEEVQERFKDQGHKEAGRKDCDG